MLDLFAPHAALLHGHDGGVNKTGTLDRVRTLAGHADTSTHRPVRFEISLTRITATCASGCSGLSSSGCSRQRVHAFTKVGKSPSGQNLKNLH